jgi:hypothetical protein
VTRVVDELVLVPDRRGPRLLHEVLHTGIRPLGDAPLPHELEVVELVTRDDVALAQGVAAIRRRQRETAILHHPSQSLHVRLLIPAPGGGRRAVEEQPPASRLLVGRQRVLGGGR